LEKTPTWQHLWVRLYTTSSDRKLSKKAQLHWASLLAIRRRLTQRASEHVAASEASGDYTPFVNSLTHQLHVNELPVAKYRSVISSFVAVGIAILILVSCFLIIPSNFGVLFLDHSIKFWCLVS
jgi:hypothetical protein